LRDSGGISPRFPRPADWFASEKKNKRSQAAIKANPHTLPRNMSNPFEKTPCSHKRKRLTFAPMVSARNPLIGLLFLLLPMGPPAFAESRQEQARTFAGDLGAIVQHNGSGSVTGTLFRVWAPNADTVSVIGSFNNWDGNRHKMKRDKGGIWELSIPSAKPGDEYLYLINGDLRRKDPRARQVTASDGNSVIYDPTAFDWGDTEFQSSGSLKDLVIYQLHIGAFHDPKPADGEPGTFADAIKKLPHLEKMGVNCILLLPVNEFHGRHSWGYNPSDLFAIESSYGGPDAFKEFVKACHQRGIAVHVDIVHNHYGPQDLSLVRFDGKGGGETDNGIYFYDDAERGNTPWGPRPDFSRREVREFIRDNVRMWFLEYKVDGLRWDSTINIRATSNGRNPNPDGESLLHQISSMIDREFPGKISIAEDSVGDPRFHSSWEYDFHHSGDKNAGIMPQLFRNPEPFRSVKDIGSRIKSDLGFRRVIYSENHDEVGRLNDNRRLLVEADENDPLSLEARRRAALAAVVTLTSPGVPLVFMGQELLETREFHDSNPLDWSGDDLAIQKVQLYRDLIRLRRNLDGTSAALTGVRTRIVKADEKNKLLTWRRHVPGRVQDDLFIIANFSSSPLEKLPVYFPQSGEWNLLLNTDDPKYGPDLTGLKPDSLRTNSSSQLLINLAPFSAQIYCLNKYEPQELDLAALREEWQAAHGEESAPAAQSDPVWDEDFADASLEEEIPAEPREVEEEFQSNAASFVVLVDFTQPKPWDPTNPEFKMGLQEDHLWNCGMGFGGMPVFSFKILNPSTGAQYGGSGIDATRLPAFGTAVEGGPPIVVTGPLDGQFLLSFNDSNLRYRFEPRAQSDYRQISLMGNFNNWNRAADLMTMTADHTWQAEVSFDAQPATEFVFIANGSLETQWGDDNPPHSGLPATGTSSLLGEPIRIDTPLNGPHRISFNELTGEYRIEPLSTSEAAPLPPLPELRPQKEINRPVTAASTNAELPNTPLGKPN